MNPSDVCVCVCEYVMVSKDCLAKHAKMDGKSVKLLNLMWNRLSLSSVLKSILISLRWWQHDDMSDEFKEIFLSHSIHSYKATLNNL